ncbi:hypothetical protein LOTGIDRAFT_215301 [Lottia gigantea]|uniref:Ras-GEF domain-containing protein n=1 Tax=Lottia gigantea TaxID=225164 RepID=V3ZUH0_LOTGI|nr:hypothetical protein LOTGIDRAFT_215301 [Lottia gigantea]ESO95133.1 hypothetical protein LOTGIDRAFT_215301 [Lottia gigantea]
MEKKMRRKSQKFYQKLIDPVKTSKDDQKGVAIQVLKDLEEMTRKVHFLQLCQTHLQMLLAEFNGIHLQYSYSLSLNIVNETLSLKPYPENPLLQFQYMVDPNSNCEIQVLQAGETQALMAYLFITCAISNGFIHQFLYTYRYFLSSDSLLNFIIYRYTAASRSDSKDPRIQCIKQRALDILYYWMEGFYTIDFQQNKTLLFRLEQFFMTQLSYNDDKQESISELLRLCSNGYKIKFNNSNDEKDEGEATLYLKLESPKKVDIDYNLIKLYFWNSFKSLTRRSPAKRVQSFKDLTSITKACNNNDIDDGFYPRITKRNDAFTLLDYTPQILVEQLTLITQEIFQQSHPIQYLNSKANGICVALSLPGLCTPSMIRRRESGGESKNLFLGQWMPSKILDELISLSHNISQWVSGELVSCSNPKAQVQLLTKFINVAQISEEIRNYSLCVSIIDGLENVIVRQLPIWRNISSKYISTMETLSKMKLKLKSEPFYLIQDSNYTLYPTIPYTLYFLLHVQQIEMGSFTLANGFIKWTKMRTICQLIDQIRIFRSNEYGFEPNFDIQDNLLQRMEEFLHLDIQAIASQNDTNFRRMSTGGLQSVLRKMKDKLGKP